MSLWSRIANVFRNDRVSREIDEEFASHLEEAASQGRDAAEARKAFGSRLQLREASREIRLWAALENTWQDVRYACRGLRRNPVFACTAVVSLGLAIGANTAIYSIVDAALLRPLPVPQPDRLVALEASGHNDTFSYPLYQQLGEAAGNSASLALLDVPGRVEAQGSAADAPYEEVVQQFVSPNAFDVLGVSPAAGRLLSPAEDHYPSPRAVVVLSYDYWRRRFGADPGIVGQRLSVSGRSYSIVGVAREGFTGAEPGKFVDVWLPITLTDPDIFTNAAYRPFHLLGRLAPGIAAEQLAARLQPAFRRHQESRIGSGTAMPDSLQKELREMKLFALPGANGISALRRTFARPLWILLGVSVCILLIACANTASLLLARSAARSGEMALRISLGARRARLVRQLLTESLLISLLAGVCGWLLAGAAAPWLVAMVSKKADPVRLDLALDTRVLLFSVGVCAVSALFFGLLPAWQATRTAPLFALRHSGGQTGRLRVGRLFVSVQVAFAFCLVTGGAGFLFSLRNLAAVNPGFDPKGVTVLTVTTASQDRDRQLTILQQLQMRAAALPQVQGAATGWMAIFSGARRVDRLTLPGKAISERAETFYRVSPGYFATLRTPLLAGRDFTFRDNENEPVPTIVNRAFAHLYFASEAVLGRQFLRDDGVRHQIVGLAADSHFGDLRGGPEPIVYFPMKPPRAFTLYLRSTLDAGSVAKMVEREAQALGSGTRVRDVIPLDALVGSTILTEKLLAGIGGAFALLGLVLAAIGLFGLLNYSVTRRTREIGIRAALGARRLPLVGLVLRDLLGMMAGGLAAGLAGSLAVMRLTRSLLFGVRSADPLVIGAAVAVFLVVALIAGGLPARRAVRIDPLAALRQE